MMATSLAIPPGGYGGYGGYGDCVVTQDWDGDRCTLTIDPADPRILIAAEVLRLASEDTRPDRAAQVRLADDIPAGDMYLGATLRIEGTNRTVVYRITGRHDEHTYTGEWPD